MMRVRSDGELLQAWQGGDREAGNQLVDRHFDAITRSWLSSDAVWPRSLARW